jgi:hypothetical protein
LDILADLPGVMVNWGIAEMSVTRLTSLALPRQEVSYMVIICGLECVYNMALLSLL